MPFAAVEVPATPDPDLVVPLSLLEAIGADGAVATDSLRVLNAFTLQAGEQSLRGREEDRGVVNLFTEGQPPPELSVVFEHVMSLGQGFAVRVSDAADGALRAS